MEFRSIFRYVGVCAHFSNFKLESKIGTQTHFLNGFCLIGTKSFMIVSISFFHLFCFRCGDLQQRVNQPPAFIILTNFFSVAHNYYINLYGKIEFLKYFLIEPIELTNNVTTVLYCVLKRKKKRRKYLNWIEFSA